MVSEPVRSTAPSNPPEAGAAGLKASKTPYTPDDQEKFIIARVLERIRSARKQPNRLPLEIEWYQCILFYLGIQWLRYDAGLRMLQPVEAPAWVPQPVNNEVQPRVDRLQAQFTKGAPSTRVRANTSEPRDRAAAKIGDAFLAHADDVVGEDEKRDMASQTVLLTGNVVSRESFNPRRGPTVQMPELALTSEPMLRPVAQCPACGYQAEPDLAGMACPACGQAALTPGQMPVRDPSGQPVEKPNMQVTAVREYHQGEIESEVILPFAFFHDPNAMRLEDAEWAGHESYLPIERIRRIFPTSGQFISEEARTSNSFYLSALSQLVGPSHAVSSAGALAQSGGATLYTYEEMPNELFDQGLLAIVSDGGVLLDYGPLPLYDQRKSELSYSHCSYSIVPGRLAGTTPVAQIVSLNRRLNGMLAQLHLNRVTLLQPWVLNPTTSGIKPGSVNMRPALVVDYNPQGGKPEIVPGTPFPPQIYEEIRQVLEAIERIMATQDVMRGDVPPGVKSGVALNYLGEAAEQTHLPRAKRWERFLASRGRKRLKLIKKHYGEARMVKVSGDGSRSQVRALSGADLHDNTDVEVETGSSLPRSRTAQIQLTFDGLDSGILGDPQTNPVLRQKLRSAVGLVGFDDDVGPDVERAEDEILRMDQGEPVMVTEYENLEVHHAIHVAEIKHPRFDDKSPQIQRLHLLHLQQTRQRWIQQQQMEMMARMVQQGGGEAGAEAQPSAGGDSGAAPSAALASGGGEVPGGEGAPTGGGPGAPPDQAAPA